MPVDIIELPATRRQHQQPFIATSPHPQPGPPPAPQGPPLKLYVATPCYGCQMSVIYLGCLMALHTACAQRGVKCMIDFIGNESLVERARNIMVARFLKSDATHLLFIDADIGFRPENVLRLLDADKDVATGVYSKKSIDWGNVRTKLREKSSEPVYQMGLDFNINIASEREPIENGFARVLDSATGFMLIKRHVLERMSEHYKDELGCVNDIQGQDVTNYVALFACMIDPVSKRFLSEDFSFCRRYQALGGHIWADIAMPLAHIGNHVFSGDVRTRFTELASPPGRDKTAKDAR